MAFKPRDRPGRLHPVALFSLCAGGERIDAACHNQQHHLRKTHLVLGQMDGTPCLDTVRSGSVDWLFWDLDLGICRGRNDQAWCFRSDHRAGGCRFVEIFLDRRNRGDMFSRVDPTRGYRAIWRSNRHCAAKLPVYRFSHAHRSGLFLPGDFPRRRHGIGCRIRRGNPH